MEQSKRTYKHSGLYAKPKGATSVPDGLPMLLTVGEAAKLGNVSPKWVRTALVSGEVKGVHLGGTWRVSRDAWLEQLGLFEV